MANLKDLTEQLVAYGQRARSAGAKHNYEFTRGQIQSHMGLIAAVEGRLENIQRWCAEGESLTRIAEAIAHARKDLQRIYR